MLFGCFGLAKDVETIAAAGFDFIELNLREVISMSEEEFRLRAFSWRGKAPLLRNLSIVKNQQEQE